METGAYPGVDGLFVHPVLDERVMAGNGVIGLELAEQLDDLDTVLVPWGGGGLSTGIASALAAVSPGTRVVACEPATGAPLRRVPRGGATVSTSTTRRRSSTAPARRRCSPRCGSARGRSSPGRSPCLSTTSPPPSGSWRRAARVVAEGAGALALAAALAGHGGTGRVVCIVSGGNIDADRLASILVAGEPG